MVCTVQEASAYRFRKPSDHDLDRAYFLEHFVFIYSYHDHHRRRRCRRQQKTSQKRTKKSIASKNKSRPIKN